MLALAQWILKGRRQAVIVVLIAMATSPWISINALIGSSALALVWLRKGEREGVFLALWALLPAVCIAYAFQSFGASLLLLSVCLAASVLRKTANWRLTLLAISMSGLIISLFLEHVANAGLHAYAAMYEQFVKQLQQQMTENKDLIAYLPKTVDIGYIAGLMGSMMLMSSFFSLILARSWQSRLYNPGGFQKEFHAIRMSRVDVFAALVMMGLFLALSGSYIGWLWIPLFPLLISGIALFHAVALNRKFAIQWYIIFYIVLIIWNPFKLVMVFLACIDSVVDVRTKIGRSKTEQNR